MKMTPRLVRAIGKLYEAFHNHTLQPESPCHCAVGNILDQWEAWRHCTDLHGSGQLNYVGKVNEAFGKRFNGYRPSELLQLEKVFLTSCGYELPIRGWNARPKHPLNQDILFGALCETVAYLCQLDGVADVMDYGALFDYQPSQTSHKPSIVSA